MNDHNIDFVPKEANPTELPQCRPIEDLFGHLAQQVYKNGWIAKDVHQLKRRILTCIRQTDFSGVQGQCERIRKKLRKCYETGPYSCLH